MSEERLHTVQAHLDCVTALERHRLGSGPDTILQVLLRHASDANSYRASQATREGVSASLLGLGIRVSVDQEQGMLTVADDGIGLTMEQLQAHFGTLSAPADALVATDAVEYEPASEDAYFRRFALTVLQLLPYAAEIVISSQSHRPGSSACRLTYAGGDQYRLEPEQSEMVGTAIQVRPRPAYRHLCDAHRLPELLRQYDDFLQFPILWEGSQVNSMSPPWHQPAATVSDYAAFLRNRDPQMPAPLLVMPVFVQRGAIEIRGVLWVPGRRLSLSDSDLGTVDLYWRRVLHEAGRADVLPRWARFVTGMLDSNVRPDELCTPEAVQSSGLHLPGAIEQALLAALRRILSDRPHNYLTVAQRQDQLLKLSALEHDELFELVAAHLLFRTTEGRQTLTEYLSQGVQNTGQTRIYYHSAPSRSMWSVSRAQTLTVIDTSEGLDEAVLRKYSAANPAVELVNIGETELSVVEELSDLQYRPLVALFADLDTPVTARPARFLPTSVAATMSPVSDDPMRPQLEQLFLLSQITGAVPAEARSAMRRALAARSTGAPQRVLHLNVDCPLVNAMLGAVQSGRHEIARSIAEVIVMQAYARIGGPVDYEQMRGLHNELLCRLLDGSDDAGSDDMGRD